MRFVFLTASSVLSLSLGGVDVRAQNFPRAETAAQSVRNPLDIKRRVAGPRETPLLADGFYAERVASNLGQITAVVTDNAGSLYAISKDTGALLHIFDRGMDGQIDMRRALATGFTQPTGLAYESEADGLYVSDKNAIWRVDLASGTKTEFVSLKNLQSSETRPPTHFPLTLYKGRLLLGLSKSDTTSSVLSIDLITGVATHLTDLPEAPIRALSYGNGQLWAAVGQALRPVELGANKMDAKRYLLEKGGAALNVMLPSQDTQYPENWPQELKGAVIAAQGPTNHSATFQSVENKNSGGNNIVMMPTQFGAPTSVLSVFAGGFLSRDAQTAWATPHAFVIDPRGLFFTDPLGGSLWRVSVDNRPPPKPRVRITEPLPDAPTQKPSRSRGETVAMSGSQIGPASRLSSASTLKVGSYLKKEHDEKEAAKLAEETAEEEAQSNAKAKAREARRLRNGGRPEASED